MPDKDSLTRRQLIKKAAYITPAIVTLTAWGAPADAKDKEKEDKDKDKKEKKDYTALS